MEPARLEYDVDADDLVAVARALAVSDPAALDGHARQVRRLVLAFTALFLTAGLMMLGFDRESVRGWGLLVGLIGMTVIGRLLWQSRDQAVTGIELATRRLAATPAGRNALGHRVVVADPDGLAVETRFAAARYRWAGATDVFESNGVLFLQFPGPFNLGLPPHAFRDDADRGRFAERVRGWVRAAGGRLGPHPGDD